MDWMSADEGGPPILSAEAERAYEFILSQSRFRQNDLPVVLGVGADTAEGVMGELSRLHLIRPVVGSDVEFAAMKPTAGWNRVFTSLSEQLLDYRKHVECLHDYLDGLRIRFADAGNATEPVEVLDNRAEVRRVVAEMATSCREEMLLSRSGRAGADSILEAITAQDEAMLRRGVKMKALYQYAAMYNRPTFADVNRASQLGAQVRTLADGLREMIIFDRSVAVVPVQDSPGVAVVVRQRYVVDILLSVFEMMWTTALRVKLEPRRRQVQVVTDDLKCRIVALMAEGMTDEIISRRLGISLRTCRKHIADIMKKVGAQTRFQAGYILHWQGIEDVPFQDAGFETGSPEGQFRSSKLW